VLTKITGVLAAPELSVLPTATQVPFPSVAMLASIPAFAVKLVGKDQVTPLLVLIFINSFPPPTPTAVAVVPTVTQVFPAFATPAK